MRAVREAGFTVLPIPGACAAIAALISSGLPTDRFVFEGFLPAKTQALNNHLEKLKNETRTIIFYESVHRIEKTLLAMQKIFGDARLATVARELTKSFESIKHDTLKNLSEWIIANPEKQKGEFVVIVQGAPQESFSNEKLTSLLKTLLHELPLKQAVGLACQITGENKNVVYDLALQCQSKLQ